MDSTFSPHPFRSTASAWLSAVLARATHRRTRRTDARSLDPGRSAAPPTRPAAGLHRREIPLDPIAHNLRFEQRWVADFVDTVPVAHPR